MPRFEDFATLSNLVYQEVPPVQVLVPTAVQGVNEVWTRIDTRSDNATGYFGAAYFNSRTKEVILVNRGTEPTDVRDLASDAQMLLDEVPAQFASAELFYRQVIRLLNTREDLQEATLSVTGHSLGGSLTQLLIATHANEVINGSGISGQTFNALGVQGLLNNPEINRPVADYAITNWVVPSDVVGNLADHVGTVASLSSLPFSYVYPLGVPGILSFFFDSHSIDDILKNFIADNRHPLLSETKEFLVKTYVTDPGFPVTIDGSAYVGGNNRLNIEKKRGTGKEKRDRLLFGRFSWSPARAQCRDKSERACEVLLPVRRPKRLLAIHACAHTEQFVLEERPINPLQPVGRQVNGRGFGKIREVQTRPRPLRGLLHQAGAHRIAQDGEEMAVMLNRKAFEAALPHMAVTPVMPMVASHMTGHPPLHECTERRFRRRLQDKVKMIRHETEAEHVNRVFSFRGGEQVEKRGVVAVLVKDDGPTVATIQHMVGMASELSTGNARHGPHGTEERS